jgi:hypothetical protein
MARATLSYTSKTLKLFLYTGFSFKIVTEVPSHLNIRPNSDITAVMAAKTAHWPLCGCDRSQLLKFKAPGDDQKATILFLCSVHGKGFTYMLFALCKLEPLIYFPPLPWYLEMGRFPGPSTGVSATKAPPPVRLCSKMAAPQVAM